jgi:HlyD family secretion protein
MVHDPPSETVRLPEAATVQEPADAHAAGADPEVIQTLGMTPNHRLRSVVVRVLLAAVVLGAIAFGVRHYVATRAREAIPKFDTVAAVRTDIQVSITATGTLEGLNTVEVGAEVSGKVVKLNVDYNDRVKKGDVLAEIDPEQLRASVEEARARVADADAATQQARATLTETRLAAKRAVEQVAQGLIAQQQVEAAQAAAERADANLKSAMAGAVVARATLKSTLSRLDKTTIVAPIDGVVLARLVEQGQTVTAGFQTPVLFKLAEDLSRLSLHVYVDEADVGRAREGQPASFTVDAYPEKTFPSKVLSLRNEPKTEQNVVSYEAVLAVDNAEHLLRPGMTATATIVAERHTGVLAVPNAALRFTPPEPKRFGPPKPRVNPLLEAGTARVWRVVNGQPEPTVVKRGVSDGRMTEIVQGRLDVGTKVIVDVAGDG